jgi:2-aminoadipate transaminase
VTYETDTLRVGYGVRGLDVRGSAIDASLSVLARLDRPVISFAMGSPATEAIPVRQIADAAAIALAPANGIPALDYAPTEGLPLLRSALLGRLGRSGAPVDPETLLITAGGMQGIDLVARLFLDPGDLVIAESPSYANGLATFHNHRARIVQVPLDRDGLDLTATREAIAAAGTTPKLIYAIPTFQNPSGLTYSLERRRGLLELARELGALVLEDDPYGELSYEGTVPPSLLELDAGQGTVIGVRTFSKIIAPGLRVGWVIAPADTIRRMVDLRQSMDTCANSLGQRIIGRMIETGDLDAHVNRLRSIYPRRRDVMIGAMEESFGAAGDLTWTTPAGGMFVWVTLPEWLDGAEVLRVGLDNGVAVVPGNAFDAVRCRSAIRLCFSAQGEDAIREGVRRLAGTIDIVSRTSVPARG